MPKHDVELWVGDDEDGCHIHINEQEDGTFAVEVVVDSESASFVETLTTFESPTLAAAKETGRYAAMEWCVNNNVNYTRETS